MSSTNKKSVKSKTLVIFSPSGKSRKLSYSGYNNCSFRDGKYFIEILHDSEARACATYNMQKDPGNFDSIAFAIWSVDEDAIIELKFEEYPIWNHSFDLSSNEERAEDKLLHYMRFLYRVKVLCDSMGDKFLVADENTQTVKIFCDLFNEGDFIITTPELKSGVNSHKENQLEKWFSYSSFRSDLGKLTDIVPSFIDKKIDDIKLYDQFPCGLFINEKKECNRIFNSGAFDLFGVDENNDFCLFELKKQGNEHLGIISELFFYSNLYFVLKDAKIDGREDCRGFSKFKQANRKVRAFFLVPKLYSFMNEEEFDEKRNINRILEVMNRATKGRIKFDYIMFDQQKVESSVGTQTEFEEAIKGKWKLFDYSE